MEQIEDKTGMTDRIVTHGYVRWLLLHRIRIKQLIYGNKMVLARPRDVGLL